MQILKRLYRGITVAVADELRPTLEWELFRSSQRMAKIIYIIINTNLSIRKSAITGNNFSGSIYDHRKTNAIINIIK